MITSVFADLCSDITLLAYLKEGIRNTLQETYLGTYVGTVKMRYQLRKPTRYISLRNAH